MRRISAADRLIGGIDRLLRAGPRPGRRQNRTSPAESVPESPAMTNAERRHSGGLMRVNHTGEVCAQALYLGQALLAKGSETREALEAAAAEEGDHLVWCEQRLDELGAEPSRLDPAWFAGSLVIGMAAAMVGDRLSLGFVEETERQVVAHLEDHLARLPESDERSRAVITAMQADESRHADNARARGARSLPPALRGLMRIQARVMTSTAYWI